MRLIDAEYLKEHVFACATNGRPLHHMELSELFDAIDDVPTIEPEQETGKWEIYVISMIDGEGCRCSECGYEGAPHWNYCPNCGAKMEV